MLDSYETIFGRANVHVKTGYGRDTGERLRFIQSGFLSLFLFFFFSQVLQLESLLLWWRPGLPFFGENRRDEMKRKKKRMLFEIKWN